MKRLFQANAKSLALSITTIMLLAAGQSITRAQTFMGNTSGSLTTAPPNAPLMYSPSTINTTATNGQAELNAPPNPPMDLNNLGSFTLTGNPGDSEVGFTGAFDLTVTFTQPFAASRMFIGSLFLDQNGNLLIDMDNDAQTFIMIGGAGPPGMFSVTVDDLLFVFGNRPRTQDDISSLQVNTVDCMNPTPQTPCTGALTGRIGPAVPEPATVLLLATGIGGLAAGVRRRKKQPAAD